MTGITLIKTDGETRLLHEYVSTRAYGQAMSDQEMIADFFAWLAAREQSQRATCNDAPPSSLRERRQRGLPCAVQVVSSRNGRCTPPGQGG